jgi:membrane-bound lytic murein transglycosylase D
MAIRTGLLALMLNLPGIFLPGDAWPVDSGPFPSDFELSSLSQPQAENRDTTADPMTAVDPKTAGDDESVWVPDDYDPWAHAQADSSRVQARRLLDGPAYEVVMNPQVEYFLDRFTSSRREIVGLWLQRSGRYLGMIREVFRSKGLPEDLAFTAMIESGFEPKAVSRAGAKGLWQFMAPTARLYGLRVDRWVDERYDPEKSTVAAAAYLRDLHARYGSWALAQAAYNAGSVRLDRAMRITGSSDFWTLSRTKHLKRETKDFVPAIQAATVIGRNPGQYGFSSSESTLPETERVTVPAGTDLRKLSAGVGIPLQALRALNPVLIRGVTPPGVTWDVRVPMGARESILVALAPRKKVVTVSAAAGGRTAGDPDIHVVRPRDTVSGIAKLYGIAIDDVIRWNNLENRDAIRPGDRLRVTSFHPSVASDGLGGFR